MELERRDGQEKQAGEPGQVGIAAIPQDVDRARGRKHIYWLILVNS